MAYRQSLMKYAEKYGVSRASRKYNKSRSYIYFWKQRWDGSVASLACQSRRPHSHPNQHTEAELKLIRDMRRRNPTLGMIKLGIVCVNVATPVARRVCFRVMRKMGMFPAEKPKKVYKTEALRADDLPRSASSGGCEGSSQSLYRFMREFAYSNTPPSTNSRACAFLPPIRSSLPTPRRISYED